MLKIMKKSYSQNLLGYLGIDLIESSTKNSADLALILSTTTMPAKSLRTLPVIYATDELQNHLPCKRILFEGDTNSTGGRSDAYPNS